MNGSRFYEQYFTASDVAAFKRVKHGQMELASVVRHTLAEMVEGGRVSKTGWELLITPKGRWRVMMGGNSENSTERIAREDAGLKALYVDNDDELEQWFRKHGYNGRRSVANFKKRVRAKLS